MSAPEPAEALAAARRHLVSLLVENKAGVLVRIAGLFSRRAFNIFSLAVAPSEDPRFSRVSVVVDVESTRLDQVLAQLDKLVNVVAITELRPEDATEAELLLARVVAAEALRSELLEVVRRAGAKVVDEGPGSLSVRLAGPPAELDAFEGQLRRFGIAELQRTGTIALPKLAAV